jgi:hypothetical protein
MSLNRVSTGSGQDQSQPGEGAPGLNLGQGGLKRFEATTLLTDTGKVVMEDDTLVGDPCIGVVVPQETAVDVDTEIDLELVRVLAQKKSKTRLQ